MMTMMMMTVARITATVLAMPEKLTLNAAAVGWD